MFRNAPLILWILILRFLVLFLTFSYLSLSLFSLLHPVYTKTILSSLQFPPLPTFVPNRTREHFLLLPSTPSFIPHLKGLCRMRLCLLSCMLAESGLLHKRQLCIYFHHWQGNFNDFEASNNIRDGWFFNLSTWSADSFNFFDFFFPLHPSGILLVIFLSLLLILPFNLHWSIGWS